MRKALRIIFSRYGIAAMILLLIFVVVGVTQTNDRMPFTSDTDTGSDDIEEDPYEGMPDDGHAFPDQDDDDGTPDPDEYEPDPMPQEAIDVAINFTEEWANWEDRSADQWQESLQPFITEDLSEQLREVDPTQVPANTIEGDAEATDTHVRIPMDTGELTLTVIDRGDSWLVSTIDWERQ